MKTRSARRSPQPRRFGPHLEILESRNLLSAGTLDLTFGAGGKALVNFSDYAHGSAVAMQADDKIVVAGYTSQFFPDFQDDFALARFNPDGTLDSTFNGSGKATLDFGAGDVATALVIQSDGKILAVGNSGENLAMARYNPDGTLDSTFGLNGTQLQQYTGHLFAAHGAAIANGWIWVAGTINAEEFGLTRFDLGGNLDHSFGDNGLAFASFGSPDDIVQGNAMAVQSDGRIDIVGSTRDYNTGITDVAVARFNTDGSLDQSFGSGGKLTTHVTGASEARAVAIQGDGRIVVAGDALANNVQLPQETDFLLVRYLNDGTLDSSFDADGIVTTGFLGVNQSPGFDFATGVAVQASGKIVAVGTSDEAFALACYSPNGSLDSNFGQGGKVLTQFGLAEANAVTLQSDGKIVATGEAYDNVPKQHVAVARYNAAFQYFDISKVGSLLAIAGTNTADVLGVHDDGFGTIRITSPREDTPPFELHGIHHVMIATGGGADVVDYHVGGTAPEVFRPMQPADVDADLGRGDDILRFLVEDPNQRSASAFNANLGAGNDAFVLIIPPDGSETPPPEADIQPSLSFTVAGGDGDDVFRTFLGSALDPESLPCPQCIIAALHFNFEGDGGQDTFLTNVANVGLDGPVTMTMSGGQGNDIFRTDFDHGDVNALLSLSHDGGEGNDSLAVTYDHGMVAGSFGLTMTGGQGDDLLTGILLPAVQRGGSFVAMLDGGQGNDTLIGRLLPAVQRDAFFMATFNGGEGNDTLVADVPPGPCEPGSRIDVSFMGGQGNDNIDVRVDLSHFTPGSSRLTVAVGGGGGSDTMVFLVRGMDRVPEGVLFTLDGGLGEDYAMISALVHVKNCEHVVIM